MAALGNGQSQLKTVSGNSAARGGTGGSIHMKRRDSTGSFCMVGCALL